jgi:hypothetical protein
LKRLNRDGGREDLRGSLVENGVENLTREGVEKWGSLLIVSGDYVTKRMETTLAEYLPFILFGINGVSNEERSSSSGQNRRYIQNREKKE